MVALDPSGVECVVSLVAYTVTSTPCVLDATNCGLRLVDAVVVAPGMCMLTCTDCVFTAGALVALPPVAGAGLDPPPPPPHAARASVMTRAGRRCFNRRSLSRRHGNTS